MTEHYYSDDDESPMTGPHYKRPCNRPIRIVRRKKGFFYTVLTDKAGKDYLKKNDDESGELIG